MRLEFKRATEQRQTQNNGDPVTVEIHIEGGVREDLDNHLYVLTEPDTALYSIVMASAASAASDADRAASIWDYFRGTLSKGDFTHLRNRVIETHDVDIDLLMQVVEQTMEVFSNFPTRPLSDSSPSPTAIGPSLTGRAPGTGSTFSDSGRHAS